MFICPSVNEITDHRAFPQKKRAAKSLPMEQINIPDGWAKDIDNISF